MSSRDLMTPQGSTPRRRQLVTLGTSIASGGVDGEEGVGGGPEDTVRVGDVITLWNEEGDGIFTCDDEFRVVTRSPQLHSSDALFELCIKYMYVAREVFLTALAEKCDVYDPDFAVAKLDELDGCARDMLQREFVAAQEEERTNRSENEYSVGTVLCHGAIVQLRHVKSGRFLCLAPAAPEMEGACVRELRLSVHGSEDAWLQILPAYKTQKKGDVVRHDEAMLLASVARGGEQLYLHHVGQVVQDLLQSVMTMASSSHVRVFKRAQPWRMRVYTSYMPGLDRVVNGGDVVRLEHKQLGLFLACSREDDKIHLLKEDCEDTIPLFSLWRFELKGGVSGAVAEHGSLCRLRHIVSGRYLSLTLDGQMPALEASDTYNTLFLTVPVFQTNGALGWGSVLHFQHDYSGYYLHAVPPGDHARKHTHATGTTPVLVAGTKFLSREDAFAISAVDPLVLRDVLLTTQAVSKLSGYLGLLNGGDGSMLFRTKYGHAHALSLLVMLRDLCSSSPGAGEDAVRGRMRRQKLLRESGVLDVCMHLCTVLHRILNGEVSMEFAGGKSEIFKVQEVFCAGHELLRDTIAGGWENGKALLGNIEELQRQIVWSEDTLSNLAEILQSNKAAEQLTSLPAATLTEMLVKNKEAILAATAAQIDFFMDWMETDAARWPMGARFLAHLCCCDGEGIRKNQDCVVRGILKNKSRSNMLMSMRLGDKGAIQIVLHHWLQGQFRLQARFMDLDLLCKSVLHSNERTIYDLLVAGLEVLHSVCAGGNYDARSHVLEMVPYEALLAAIAKDSLTSELRRHCVKLMHYVYVERSSIDYIMPRVTTHLLAKLDANSGTLPQPLFEPDKEVSSYRTLKDKVIIGLQAGASARVPEPEQDYNKLTLAHAELANQLLTLGFFSSEADLQSNVGGLLPTLLMVLEGASDHVYTQTTAVKTNSYIYNPAVNSKGSFRSSDAGVARSLAAQAGEMLLQSRYVQNEHTESIVATKLVGCKMLLFVLDLRLYARIQRLLVVYKSSITARAGKGGGAGQDELKTMQDKMKLNCRDDFAKAAAFLAFPHSEAFSSVLIDLLHYQNADLAVAALQVLFRERNSNLELYRELFNMQVLVDPTAVSAYTQCQLHLRTIRRLLPALKEGILNYSDSVKTLSPLIVADMKNAITSCTGLCESDNRETMRRAGLHTLILDIISMAVEPYGDPNGRFRLSASAHHQKSHKHTAAEGGPGKELREILNLCMRFIDKFCRESSTNQEAVYPHVPLLLTCMGNGLGATMAASSVLHDNETLSLRLSESVIQNVVDVIAGTRKGSHRLSRKPHYLQFLHGLCLVGGKVMARNQMYVLKYLSESGPLKLEGPPKTPRGTQTLSVSGTPVAAAREKALLLFRGEEGRAERARLYLEYKLAEAKRRDADKPTELPEALRYNVEMLKLLGTLLLDYNPVAFARVQLMLPPDKICDDLQASECIPEAKGHLLNLMRLLYLSKEVHHMRHPLLGESFLDMIKHFCQQMSEVPLASFSKHATNFPKHELHELLVKNWAPLLLAALQSDGVLGSFAPHGAENRLSTLSLEHKSTGTRLVDCVVDLLNEQVLEPKHAYVFLQIYEAARHLHLSGTSILTDKAREVALTGAGAAMQGLEVNSNGAALMGLMTKSGRMMSGGDVALRGGTRAVIEVFAKVFLDSVDPLREKGEDLMGSWGTSGVGALGPRGEEGAEEEEEIEVRRELMRLCRDFQNKDSLHNTKRPGQAQVKEFRADEADYLVRVLLRYPAPSALDSGGGYSWNVAVGLSVLRVLAVEWRESATELLPPLWLLEGVPALIHHIISNPYTEDRVCMCALELGIAILHGGNDAMQESFLRLFQSKGGAPDFFKSLKRRLERGAEEARVCKARFEEMLTGGEGGGGEANMYMPDDRSIHAVATEDVRRSGGGGSSHVGLVLRFMQLLCEGHNMDLQNYLRHQPMSARSVDMISATAAYLDALTPYINPLNIHIATKAMDALAEFVQNPCRENQRALSDTKLCACANEILDIKADAVMPDDEGDAEFVKVEAWCQELIDNYEVNVNNLKASTVIALQSLLECVDNHYIPDRMLASLDFHQLIDNMNHLLRVYDPRRLAMLKRRFDAGEIRLHIPKGLPEDFWIVEDENEVHDFLHEVYADQSEHGESKWVDAEEESKRRQDAEHVAQHYYITYITLAAFDSSKKMSHRFKEEYIWDLKTLQRKVGVIEISRKGVLEKAYFSIPSVCSYLTEDTKKQILFGVNRANLQTQLTGFSECFDMFYDEMKHQKKLTERRVLRMLRSSSPLREKLFFFNAILINVLMLIFYGYQCEGVFICGDLEPLEFYRIQPGWNELVIVLAVIQCILAITRQCWYVVERGLPRAQQQIYRHRMNPPKHPLLAWLVRLPSQQSDPTHRHLRRRAVGFGVLKYLHVEKVFFVRIFYLCTDLYFVGISAMTMFNLLALLLNAQGAKLFLMIHMLEVFNHSAVLRTVIQSITYRGDSLIQTGGFVLVMYYFFGVIGFILFPQIFQFGAADIMGGRKLEPNNNSARCTSIWKCTLLVLDIGLRKGDVGEALDDIEWKVELNTPDRYYIFYRIAYTFFFFAFVTTILMNIIFGIIIDTFAELRERKDEIDNSITGACFVCGIPAFMFDLLSTTGSGFDDHVANDHNMWKYLYFQVYLREKDFDQYSGGESYVFQKTLRLVKDPLTHETVKDVDTGKELKVAKPQIDLLWYPQMDAMVLKNQRASVDQQVLWHMRELEINTSKLTTQITAQIDKITELNDKAEARAR